MNVATHEHIKIFNREKDPKPLRRKPTLIETLFPTVRFRRDLARKEEAINSNLARYRAETEMKIASMEATQRELERKLLHKEQIILAQKELMKMKTSGKSEEKAMTTRLPQTADEQAKLFTKIISQEIHDLRTPLTAVTGAAMVLESEELPPSVSRLISMIVKNSLKMKGMLEDTLLCNKLLHGKVELNKKSYDIAEQISGIVNDQTLAARGQKKEISFKSSLESIHICGDELKLGRVFENLISNAIKFSTKHVSVSLETYGKKVIVKVDDDGAGVAEEIRHKVFEMFSTDMINGNGFGLTNAKRITEMHGGDIVLESEVGEGSTFVVTLPLA